MKALAQAAFLGRAAGISGDDEWGLRVLRRVHAEWPPWVNGPSALLEAYRLGFNMRSYRAVLDLEQSLRKPANIVVLRRPK
jgi:hypothetical protein